MQQLGRKIYLIFAYSYKEILVYYTKGKDSNFHPYRSKAIRIS